MSLDESGFHAIADRTLQHLVTVIDRELGDDLDADIDGGILSVGLPDGGQYVVNKNAHLKQIWLSSPKSGAWHFVWNEAEAAWLSTRHEHVRLNELVAAELEQITGTAVAL